MLFVCFLFFICFIVFFGFFLGFCKGICVGVFICGIVIGVIELNVWDIGWLVWKLCEGWGCWRCWDFLKVFDVGVGGMNLDLYVNCFDYFVFLLIKIDVCIVEVVVLIY